MDKALNTLHDTVALLREKALLIDAALNTKDNEERHIYSQMVLKSLHHTLQAHARDLEEIEKIITKGDKHE